MQIRTRLGIYKDNQPYCTCIQVHEYSHMHEHLSYIHINNKDVCVQDLHSNVSSRHHHHLAAVDPVLHTDHAWLSPLYKCYNYFNKEWSNWTSQCSCGKCTYMQSETHVEENGKPRICHL